MLDNIPFKTALLLVPLLVAGCAPAYHTYSNGCVPHGYCAPPPLPHVCYPPPACGDSSSYPQSAIK